MTIIMNLHGDVAAMHMHGWANGGGEYANVIELAPHGPNAPARVTLIGDSVDAYPAHIVREGYADALATLLTDYPFTEDYAGADASDLPAIPGVIAGRDYVVVSHGVMLAIHMY